MVISDSGALVSAEWAFGGADGRGVRVAIVDSGIDIEHPALTGHVEDGAFLDADLVLHTGTHDDLRGHGTACAGIVRTLAPAARLSSVRVVTGDARRDADALVLGLQWAVEQRFDVINVSVGTGFREVAPRLEAICDRAQRAGTLVVTAASNRPRASYPSAFDSVVSVAGANSLDPYWFRVSRNSTAEFLARGVDVDVAWRGGTRAVGSGNSYAAAHLSALAALVKSKHSRLDGTGIRSVLRACAEAAQNARESTAARPTRTDIRVRPADAERDS